MVIISNGGATPKYFDSDTVVLSFFLNRQFFSIEAVSLMNKTRG
jgi:hypothetical protein